MRIYFCIFFFTLLACLFLSSEAGCPVNQVFDPTSNMCRDNCPTYYYEVTQSSLQICISQTQVKNILRPTLEPFTFLLIFDNVNYTIIPDITDLWTVLTFSLDSSSSVTPLTTSDLTLTFLDLDKTIIQIDLAYQSWMKYPTTLIIDFKDLSTTQTNNYYFKSEQLSISLLPFDTFSSTQENFLNVLKKMNFGLEIAWTAVSLLNYYPVAYLQGKQYREMFNLYKMTGVTYSPIALEFFRETNEKIAGVKVPNLFSILLYNQGFSSGWDADMNKRVLLQNDPFRDDYKLILNERFMEFNSSPLFLENLGIEIILVAGLLIGVVVTEILAFLFFNDEEAETIFYTFFMFIRVLLRWNFLFATLIGALPSLMYFAFAQIQSFALYGTLGHNLVGGIVSIVVILAIGIIFPLIVFEKIRLVFRIKEKTLEIINYNEVMTLDFFGIFHEYFKIDSIFYPMFILVFMIRSMLVSAICLFLTNKPVAQAILMLIMSIVILAALILFKPYAKKHYNVFQIGLETINLIMLLIMLITASSSKAKLLDSGFIGTLNIIMVLLWVFTPLWVTGFGVYVIAIKFRRTKVQKPPATFRSRKISIRASMRASVRIHPIKTGIQPRIQLDRRPERPKMFETFKFEQNSASSPQNTMDNLSPTRSPTRWLSESPTQPSFRSIANATQRSQIKSRTQIVPDSSSSNSNSPLMSGSHSRIMIRSNTNISKDPIEAIELKQSKLPPGIPIQLAAIKAGEVENLETKKEEDEQLFELNSRRELITITKI